MTTTNGIDSWLYNITYNGGSYDKTLVPGVVLHNLHVDLATGAAYTIALEPGSAVVIQVLLGAITPLVDLSSYLNVNSTITPGASTQCSDVDILWVHVTLQNDTSPGSILSVSLPQRTVTKATPIKGPVGFTTLWAACDDATDVNKLGGSATLDNGKTVAYGTLSAITNAFVPTASVPVPAGKENYQLSGLLSEPV